jgi:N-acetylglucosamine kinase-like BadF-type ATPase
MSYFLGIDGGGTKTTCMLGDSLSVIATETAGGSNVVRHGEDKARAAIEQALRAASASSGVPLDQIVAVCAGVGGAAQNSTREQIRHILAELIPGRILVVGDMVVAHEAALDGEIGIVVIAGTGSIAYGRNEGGKTARAGGWGYMISDEGSGHWIGVQAVAAITRAMETNTSTALSKQVLGLWHLKSLDDLILRANGSPSADFAGLFPAVLAAEDDDSGARQILEEAGTQLAALAEGVYRRLWTDHERITVAMSGGVFQNSQTVRQAFCDAWESTGLKPYIRLSKKSAAEGALSLARKMVLDATG